MSTEIWKELDAQQKQRRDNHYTQTMAKSAELEAEKAKILKEWGGKKYNAPDYIQKIIENMQQAHEKEWGMDGRLAKQLAEKEAEERTRLTLSMRKLETHSEKKKDKENDKDFEPKL